MSHLRSRLLAAGTLLALLGLLAFGAVRMQAQGTTAGTPSAAAPTSEPPHPAHIHEGTCTNLNPTPKYPLADVTYHFGTGAASPVASPAAGMVGAASALPAEGSVTKVPVSLKDLLSGHYAINVHESATDINKYIACGDIGGILNGNNLVFGIHEQNNSGFSGIAWLQDNGDGTTTVTLFMAHNLAVSGPPAGPPASPAVSPAASPAASPSASPVASPAM